MKKTQILVCVLFGLIIAVVYLQSISTSHPQDVAIVPFLLQTVSQAVGVFVSAAACLAVLLKAIGGANQEQLVSFLIPLFAGLLLVQVHWTLAGPLGFIILGLVIRPILEMFRPRAEKD